MRERLRARVDARQVDDDREPAEHGGARRSQARAVVELARGLRVSVLAEGVETEDQHALLKSFGCHSVQGFLLGKPMAPDAFAAHFGEAGETTTTKADATAGLD